MLSGRESLIRLVGKRRRFLPNRQSLLSIPIPIQSSFSLCVDVNGRIISVESQERLQQEEAEDQKSLVQIKSDSDWVICPVCGSKVRGEDDLINSHLDACLSRGTKRKLTQSTLLQFNFCSQPASQIPSSVLENLRADSVCGEPHGIIMQNTLISFENSGAFEVTNSKLYGLPLAGEPVVETSIDGSIEKPINDEGMQCQVDSCSLSLLTEVPKCDVVGTADGISAMILETIIVGRRFSIEKELKLGARISLLRDPDNVKDPNAIKVLLADSSSSNVLGFLPRDLAQYLSPLIEKYSLIFEGCVTSLPEHSLDAVPIQIISHKIISHGNNDCNESEAFTFLWKNALHVAKSVKNYSPSMTKYQQNFCLLIQEVLRSNCHLFTDDERSFMESYFSLSDDSQRLFVRLYTRKGPWFRISKISYPEVLDTQQAIKALSVIGYVCSSEGMNELADNDMDVIMNLLSVFELREITCMFKKNCTRGTRKHDLVASLYSSYLDGVCPFLPSAILARMGTCIKISSKAESLFWRAERLFFLNGEQDLSAFLLADLGLVKYPTYDCIISKEIFSTRADLLAYEEAIEVAQIMDESLDDNNSKLVLRCIEIAGSYISSVTTNSIQSTTSESVATFLSCFSASWVYSQVVFLGVSFLEHERRYKDAIYLLKLLLTIFTSDGRRGYWTLRLSIDLEHIGCPNESLSVAEDGLMDPLVRAGPQMALQRRVLRLGKPPRRWKVPSFSDSIKRQIRVVHIQGRPLNCETGMKGRFYGEDGDQCGVEQLALQYYAGVGGGWQGVHTESGIWLTIFGLLMWDIIFSNVPNVFRNRFQIAPLDLETDGFYLTRKSLTESHLQKIHGGMAEEILITSWELHSGTACKGVNWDRFSLCELRSAVTCVGGPCLASLCRHLAQDYRSWSSGMPDLLLWRFHGEYKGEAKLVEVKGPRDCLSEQQRAWLLLLMDCGFNAEICRVSPVPLST